MKKNISFILVLFFSFQASFAQVNDGLIELGKAYRQFMFRNNPPEDFLKGLDKYQSTELAFPAKFVREAIRENSSILTDAYLKRPSDKDLKYLYIVMRINYNVRKENPLNNDDLIKELMGKEILTQDLVDNYYAMLAACYGNKVKRFDMSAVNFNMKDYELKNETEKAIFF